MLQQLFGSEDTPATRQQRLACERAALGRLTLITGGPGTGKTYTAARLLWLLQSLHTGREPLRVALAAPTGKAAARLRQSVESAWAALPGGQSSAVAADAVAGAGLLADMQATTLHKLLSTPVGAAAGRRPPEALQADVVLVDEASMIDADMMDSLLSALPPSARLVMLGDADQLASIEAGSVLADVAAAALARPTTPLQGVQDGSLDGLARQTVHLSHSHRFSGAIGQLAAAVRAGDAATVRSCFQQAQLVEEGEASPSTASTVTWLPWRDARGHSSTTVQPAISAALAAGSKATHRHWMERLAQAPGEPAAHINWVASLLSATERFRLLCALREGPLGVSGLNRAIEDAAQERGWLSARAPWYTGRLIMVTRNDAALSLFNGDTGLVLPATPSNGRSSTLVAWFASASGGAPRSVALTRLPPVETALAMTVHKSQGSEFEHAMLVLPAADNPLLTRELLYTGITRAKRHVTVCASDMDSMAAALARRSLRFSGLQDALRRSA